MIEIICIILDFYISFIPTTYSAVYCAWVMYTINEFPIYFCNTVAFHQYHRAISICSQESILNGLDTQKPDEVPTIGSWV